MKKQYFFVSRRTLQYEGDRIKLHCRLGMIQRGEESSCAANVQQGQVLCLFGGGAISGHHVSHRSSKPVAQSRLNGDVMRQKQARTLYLLLIRLFFDRLTRRKANDKSSTFGSLLTG